MAEIMIQVALQVCLIWGTITQASFRIQEEQMCLHLAVESVRALSIRSKMSLNLGLVGAGRKEHIEGPPLRPHYLRILGSYILHIAIYLILQIYLK